MPWPIFQSTVCYDDTHDCVRGCKVLRKHPMVMSCLSRRICFSKLLAQAARKRIRISEYMLVGLIRAVGRIVTSQSCQQLFPRKRWHGYDFASSEGNHTFSDFTSTPCRQTWPTFDVEACGTLSSFHSMFIRLCLQNPWRKPLAPICRLLADTTSRATYPCSVSCSRAN